MKKIIIILGVVGASLSAILVKFSDVPSMVLVLLCREEAKNTQ